MSLQDVARQAAVTAHDSLPFFYSSTSGVDQTLYRIADAVLAAVLAEQAKESPKLVKDSRRSSCWAVGFPDTERKVCELPFGHDGYHRQGAISWLGYHQPLAPPQTPEPSKARKYSACRICGRGPQTMAQHIAIATFGVHTDAVHQPNQPNNGTAYCDQCEDETLVIQPSGDVAPMRLAACVYGHTTRKVGCVSCVLVFDSRPLAPAVEPAPPLDALLQEAIGTVEIFAETDTQAFKSERKAMLDVCAALRASEAARQVAERRMSIHALNALQAEAERDDLKAEVTRLTQERAALFARLQENKP